MGKVNAWLYDQTRDEIFNVNKGVVEVALNLPVFVAAGPQVKAVLKAASPKDVVEVASSAVLVAASAIQTMSDSASSATSTASSRLPTVSFRTSQGDVEEQLDAQAGDIELRNLPPGAIHPDDDHDSDTSYAGSEIYEEAYRPISALPEYVDSLPRVPPGALSESSLTHYATNITQTSAQSVSADCSAIACRAAGKPTSLI